MCHHKLHLRPSCVIIFVMVALKNVQFVYNFMECVYSKINLASCKQIIQSSTRENV